MIVVDASVAIKWFIDGEVDRAGAFAVLDAIASDPSKYAVPELFFNEVLAVLAGTHADAHTLGTCITDLEDLGFHRIGNGHELLQEAARLAVAWRLSGYDAVYVATAKLVGGQWLTADRQAAKRIADQRLVCML